MAFVADPSNTTPGPISVPRWSLARLGVLFAWIAVIIYAASNSIVTQLVEIGAANPVGNGRNAITYSNLLLLGSLLSVIPMAILFRRDLTRENVRALTPRNWRVLTLSAFLSSALTPGLFFYALANTTVTNVVLISRIEPPLFLLAAWLVFNEHVSRRAMTAGLVALAGAIVMIGMGEDGGLAGLGTGEWAAVAATLSYIASTLVARKGLRDIPMGIFAVYRTLVGSAFYVVLAVAIFGPGTFRDLLAPVLWSWIWLYAGLVVVLGQIAWNLALKHASSGDLALATSFSPLAAIMIAMALLGEDPGPGLVPGALLIVLAIFIGRGVFARSTEMPQDMPNVERPAPVAVLPGQPCIACDYQETQPRPPRVRFALPRISSSWTTLLPQTTAPPGRVAQPAIGRAIRRPSARPF